MPNVTTQQLAEILLGIARSQLAIADAMESSKAGFKSTHLRSTVESAARLKVNRPVALVDFPARLLLQMMGRSAPTADQVKRELDLLLANAEPSGSPSGESLDMTK